MKMLCYLDLESLDLTGEPGECRCSDVLCVLIVSSEGTI